MSHLLKHLLFSLTFFLISPHLLVVHSATHPSDIKALVNLKARFERASIGPGTCLSTWDFSLDPCSSLFTSHFTCGLRCDYVDPTTGLNRVTDIALDSANYSGSLGPTPIELPHLQNLDLSGNALSGAIPDSLAMLTRLRRLSLSRNAFSATIPAALGSIHFLEELYLDNNSLQGRIPPTFNKLPRLTRLEIQNNQLSGTFPFLGSLKNLTFLDVSENNVDSIGTNPLSLPTSLISISMRGNRLTGRLPTNFLHMKFLEVLDLSYNKLDGVLSGEIFLHPSIQQLSLSHNLLSGLDPPRVGRPHHHGSSRIVAVDLSYNHISGNLPKFLASDLPRLSALSLEQNQFTGVIPKEYVKRVQTGSFQRLLLGGNYLVGPIPGPLKRVKPGLVNVSLVDNCLRTCPESLFFCKGGVQKSVLQCKALRKPTAP